MAQKIRIKLKAYDHKVLDQSAEKIVDTVKRTGARISGPVPLPIDRNLYCVIRSPHIDKESMEHFELRTYKRLIDILEPTSKTVDALMHLDLPAGVDIKIKVLAGAEGESMPALLGKKLGMNQIFADAGNDVPVTVVAAGAGTGVA